MDQTQNIPAVRLSTPPDIAGAIPFLVGFHPSESLVIVCTHGRRNRTGFVLRVDLPEPEHVPAFAVEMASRVASEKADSVIMVCFTEQPDSDGVLARADLIDVMLDELGLREIGWMEALLVRGGTWWSYTCDKPCCPQTGTPLPTAPSGSLARLEAQSALDGRAVLPGRDALEKSVSGPVAVQLAVLRQQFEQTADELADRLLTEGIDTVRRETLDKARSMFQASAHGGRDISDADAARIVVGLVDKWPRDVLITWGLDKRDEEVLAFLTGLAQRAPDEYAAPICTVLGAVAYQNGRGALASVALERALRIEPDYEMAQLLQTLLDGQINPREIRAIARRTKRELGQSDADDDCSAA